MAGRRNIQRGSGRIAGALDIGTSKIACLIGEVMISNGEGDDSLRVLGLGVQRSIGVKSGVIAEPMAVEAVVRACVAQAERSAGVALREVFLSITCGRLKSLSFAAHAEIGPRGVRDNDIARIHEGARCFAERDHRGLVHMNPNAYRLDGVPGGDDPRGMAASRLSADIHAVTADEGAIRNLIHLVERCDLSVAGLVAAPYASALAVTSAEERRLGTTVVDMGGGTTSIAVFSEGQFVHCDAILAGGHHLTFEIAQNLHAPLAEAERIKALYASMVNAQSDVSDSFSYTTAGNSEGRLHRLTRAQLADVVRPRVEIQVREIAHRLANAGWTNGPILLTGGASQLVGLAEFTGAALGREVVIGAGQSRLGLPAHAGSPALAAAVGLALAGPVGQVHGRDRLEGRRLGYAGRVGRWVKGGF